MEYSIGSVADLISGSTTPNKPKVVKKQFKMKPNKQIVDETELEKSENKKEQKKLKKKRKSDYLEEVVPKQEEFDENKDHSVKKIKGKPSKSPKIKQEEPEESPDLNESVTSDDEELTKNSNRVKREIDENKNQSVKRIKRKRSKSPKIKQEDPEESPDVNESDTSDDEEVTKNSNRVKREIDENKEQSVKKIKRKRSKSPKIKQEDPEESSDVNESDTSDDEGLTKNSNRKKEKLVTEIIPKNPDHITIFVGNLPISTTHKKLQKLFSKFGNVVNARIRSIPVADPKIPKRVAAIKKHYHLDRKSVHGYVTFSAYANAENALSLNGQEYKGHHIRVNICDKQQNLDKTKAIFLGNVSFAAEEEELWKLFESCGEIESVRLVRDRRTDIGKGFGYINFKSADSVELALQMGEVKLRDRALRISLYNGKAPKKENTQMINKNVRKSNKQQKGPIVTTATNGEFQGKFSSEKKKRFHKGNQQRKNLAKKIAPKTMST